MCKKKILATFTLRNINSAICGYHVYKDVWPFMGKVVCYERKERNAHNPSAVVLKKSGTGTVGHQHDT